MRSLTFERLTQGPGEHSRGTSNGDWAFLSQNPALLGRDQKGGMTLRALTSSPSQHRMESGPFLLEQMAGADKEAALQRILHMGLETRVLQGVWNVSCLARENALLTAPRRCAKLTSTRLEGLLAKDRHTNACRLTRQGRTQSCHNI